VVQLQGRSPTWFSFKWKVGYRLSQSQITISSAELDESDLDFRNLSASSYTAVRWIRKRVWLEETTIHVDSVRRVRRLMKYSETMKHNQQETSEERTVVEETAVTVPSHNLVTWTDDADSENPR